MIERYEKEIIEIRNLTYAITVAMNELFKISAKGADKKVINKQKTMFDKLRQSSSSDKFNKKWQNYTKNSYKNLRKIKNNFDDIDLSKIRQALQGNPRGFDYSTINTIMNTLEKNHSLEQKIEVLASRYEEGISKIRMLKKMIKDEKAYQATREQDNYKKTEEIKTPVLTPEQLQEKRKQEELEIINENASVLLNGPKNGNLISTMQGKDTMIQDMGYLYGLAIDILIIMNSDQYVELQNVQHGKEARIWNAYFESMYMKKTKINHLLEVYGVKNIDDLLNKYEKIRKDYNKKYSKLSSEKKEKYGIENFDTYEIYSSLSDGSVSSTLLSALKNENLKFPPSKEALISLINSRIMNGKNYSVVEPKKGEEVVTANPQDRKEYQDKIKYYKNLTKNMSVEEVARLYHRVVNDMYNGFKYSSLDQKTISAYYAVMQKMFCEIIFDKKGMKISDSKQYDAALNQIAKEILKEDLKYSIYGYNNVNENEKKERQETIQKDYIKYRAKITSEGKKDFMSFREFVQQKYALNYVEEPKNLEKKVEEEIKGMKR